MKNTPLLTELHERAQKVSKNADVQSAIFVSFKKYVSLVSEHVEDNKRKAKIHMEESKPLKAGSFLVYPCYHLYDDEYQLAMLIKTPNEV